MEGKTTFWQLLSSYTIEIPVIQRDYAQGRKSAETIRTNFLDSIVTALEAKTSLDLNFIYGSREDESKLIPIDGQQRLTTLFLLHLYLIGMTGRTPTDYPQLKNFTYKTRMESEDFCESITSNGIGAPDGKNLKEVAELHTAIVDNPWFSSSWQYDPTVEAMLNMLDSIHSLLSQRDDLDELLDLLLDENACPLYFYFLDLDDYGLEDSTYIKMNARGKPLSDYENFKAKFEKFLDDRQVPKRMEYAESLDTEWTSLFWALCKDAKEPGAADVQHFDERMMDFIFNYISNDYANYSNAATRLDLRKEIQDLLAMTKIEFTNEFASFTEKLRDHPIEQSFIEMFKAFSLMADQNGLKEYAPGNGFMDEGSIFRDIIVPGKGINDFTGQTRAWFYAYTQYLLANEDNINAESLTEWFRVIKHLIDGQFFSTLDEYAHVIKGIGWMARNSGNILNFLASWQSDGQQEENDDTEGNPPYFNLHVFKEECIKAALILKSEAWNLAIRNAESNAYLDGSIYAALEFSGIVAEEQPVSEWSDEKSRAYLEKFTVYTAQIDGLFNQFDGQEPGLKKEYGNVFRRALLTKGDYTLNRSSNISLLVDRSNDRGDVTWKRLLKPQRGQDSIIKRGYLKALLDDPNYDMNDVVGSCEKIVAAYDCSGNDLRYFIEIPEVMEFMIGQLADGPRKGAQCWNFFRNNGQSRYLLCSTQLNGNNYEYNKYALYCVLRRKNQKAVELPVKSGIADTQAQPILIHVSDEEVYAINWDPETATFSISGGKYAEPIIKSTLEDMSACVESEKLLG